MNPSSWSPARLACVLAALAGLTLSLRGAEPTVFSGPQVGESTTPFKVLDLRGPQDGAERDPIAANAGAPTALVFVHTLERSLAPLLRVVDAYGARRKDRIRTELVFLAPDRLAGEQRIKAAARSLRLENPVGLSLDGAEGPGNYGLNKECLMTIVAARDNRVTANFALVQPGIADAPRILEALARTCGDTNPPALAELAPPPPARSEMTRPASSTETNAPKRAAQDPFPGAVPTDDRLQFLLRRFIRATNDVATTDAILADVRSHIAGKPDLVRQAVDGWTRVLHFGDRYGNEYSRKVGLEFRDRLRSESTTNSLPPIR